MLRVTTLYASSAAATAKYYTRYLAQAPGEAEGIWTGRRAAKLGLAGAVDGYALERLLEGRHPVDGGLLGAPFLDRSMADGRPVRAVAGFDATFSAPKSLSVWWALTGDPGLLEAHDFAVTATLEHLERRGATTRIRQPGHRLHPDALGLTMATFRQTTSRADDPQIHTHAVISAKVQTDDGRWFALDARYLKRHQRTLGGLYQSVLRAEVSHRYGVTWGAIVNGQAEIDGVDPELLARFSKRSVQVDAALQDKLLEFARREGRDPTRGERAALEREAAADTRGRKSGRPVADLNDRWRIEARELGCMHERLTSGLTGPGSGQRAEHAVTVEQVLDALSAAGSAWSRADVLRAVCDVTPAPRDMSGRRWAAALDRAVDRVLEHCVDIDPITDSRRRRSDGRSVWLEPIARQWTSPAIEAEEDRILTWALDAQVDPPRPSDTVRADHLDMLQSDAAAAVAGRDRLVVVVGPAGTGKTTMLAAAADDLARCGRPVFGVSPTAKAAHVLTDGAGLPTDTVAKLLHEWHQIDRAAGPRYRLAPGTTLVVDEAGMVGTTSLRRLVDLADRESWRLVLVGDARQLQAVGRGGMFAELCRTSRTYELARIHRFTHVWEADASLQLRTGQASALDTYLDRGRIRPGPIDAHLAAIAERWSVLTGDGMSVAVTASSNAHVDALNAAIQRARRDRGELQHDAAPIAGGENAHVGEIVVTRRNARQLITAAGQPVRNRETWTVAGISPDGSLCLAGRHGQAAVTVPPEYATEHVRLGYAATEHGHQGDTVDVGIALVTSASTHRGLYVAMTRGREANELHVVTADTDIVHARDVLEGILTHDRADEPTIAQRRRLHEAMPDVGTGPPRPNELPSWVGPWRARLDDRRSELLGVCQRAEAIRDVVRQQIDELRPALDDARLAWGPHAQRISEAERHLRGDLRRAVTRAENEARRARLGRRQAARDLVAARRDDVAAGEASLEQARAEGAPVKARFDEFDRQSRALYGELRRANDLDRDDRHELYQLDQVLEAVDAFVEWTRGRPVPPATLTEAFHTLEPLVRHATSFSVRDGEIDRGQWNELLGPGVIWLREHGIEPDPNRPPRVAVHVPEANLRR
jgi:conjugative relaxase-like TrwC/TraI family protein